MKFSDLTQAYPGSLRGNRDVEVSGVEYDSRNVKAGDVFFCITGFDRDGHSFLQEAVSRGAVAAVVERPLDSDVLQFVVDSSRSALAALSARFFAYPTKDLTLIGVTGTNGKTTTTYILDSIYQAAGARTGVIGTVVYKIGDEVVPVSRTTPESSDLQRLFRNMVDSGISACAMEVSSHAIDLHRVDECDFDALIFTNLTQDHLDYHGSMEAYAAAKRAVFEASPSAAHILNVDDPVGRDLAAKAARALTYALVRRADVTAADVKLTSAGSSFTLGAPTFNHRVRSPLRGTFNVYNSLGAAGAATALGVNDVAIVRGLERVGQVPGRFESVDAEQGFAVLVDYAHTPDSLEQVLVAAREITARRLIVVFGCGGDRDAGKRPQMGRIASERADLVIITSDNPRSEDPETIVA